jgi:ABC-2 type transport system permease protein
VRWLLQKDLKILWRSKLLLVLLVLYPVVVAVLIGLSFSGGPEKPKIAFVNEIPSSEKKFSIGGQGLDLGLARSDLEKHVDPVIVSSREQAEQQVRDGDVLGAVVIPEDTVTKLQSTVQQPTVEVIVNEEDPLKARLVNDTIDSALADANRRVSQALTRTNIEYLNLILSGGSVDILGRSFNVLGLKKIGTIVEQARKQIPRGSPTRAQLDEVIRFNDLAQQNFGLVNKSLEAIGQPIKVEKTVLKGSKVPLTTFAVSVAVAISLMLITVLLASASLALERDENTFGRLVRGPVSASGLLAEKIVLAVCCAAVVAMLMLVGLSLFVSLEWARFGAWVIAVLIAALSFAAFGTAIGAVAREVSAATLLAFTLLLPVAFLALVPTGVVDQTLYDLTRVLSALFPFKATVDAMNSALYGNGTLWQPLAHLVALAVAWAAAARVALRRFA